MTSGNQANNNTYRWGDTAFPACLGVGIALALLCAGIALIAVAVHSGPHTPPCGKGGIHRIYQHAENLGNNTYGTLVICNNGHSYWP